MKNKIKSLNTRVEKMDYAIFIFLFIYSLLIIYPFYNSFLISISSEKVYLDTPFMLYPKELNLEAYITIFKSSDFWNGYGVTLFLVVVGGMMSLVLTTMGGFVLSRDFPFKNLILNLIIFTMFFSGGLIPTFEVIKNLKLINKIWVMILPGVVDTFSMLLIRNYFNSLPKALGESAKIDGANDIVLLYRIYLPLALPIVATIGLFYAVGYWNSWYGALLYISNNELKPLQLVLREMIVTSTSSISPPPGAKPVFSEALKMASIFLTIIPIMCLYPFLQRFFVKGIIVGALKG